MNCHKLLSNTDIFTELSINEMETINGGLVKELFMGLGLVVAAMVNDWERVQSGREIQTSGQKSVNSIYN